MFISYFVSLNRFMTVCKFFITAAFVFNCILLYAQDEDKLIHSKEGNTLVEKKILVLSCMDHYGAGLSQEAVKNICSCQVNLLDRRYSNKELKTYQKKYKGGALSKLVENDSMLQAEMNKCVESVRGMSATSIPEYKKAFISNCIKRLSFSGVVDTDSLRSIFCNCAADILENRKISIDQINDLGDPSSFLYNEVAVKCGSPVLKPSDVAKDWSPLFATDIVGSQPVDTVQLLAFMGMHKLKLTIGGETRIWLLDSGASDLLISDDFFRLLLKKGYISDKDYKGEGRYVLANGSIDKCKKYLVNNIRIGSFLVNNVIVSVSLQANDFLVGKSLLNKFLFWTIDNKNNYLILHR